MRHTLIALLLTFIYFAVGHFVIMGLGALYTWLALQPWWLVVLLGGTLVPFLVQIVGAPISLLGYAVSTLVGRIGIGIVSVYFLYGAAVLLWEPAVFEPASGFSLFLSRMTCSLSALAFFGSLLFVCFNSEEK